MYETVTEQVISQDEYTKYDRAMARRHELATDIVNASLEFVSTEGEMEYMHINSITLTKDAVDNLISKCLAYKKNLGW